MRIPTSNGEDLIVAFDTQITLFYDSTHIHFCFDEPNVADTVFDEIKHLIESN